MTSKTLTFTAAILFISLYYRGYASAHSSDVIERTTLRQQSGDTIWTASPVLTARLAPPSNVGHWSLRMPKGCKLSISHNTNGFIQSAYTWPVRKDKSVTFLVIDYFEGTLPQPDGPEAKLRETLANIDAHTIDGKSDLVTSDPEYCEANGVSTIRQYFKYVDDVHEKVHGLAYIFLDARGLLTVSGIDSEPYSSKTIPLIEAAALTVHATASTD